MRGLSRWCAAVISVFLTASLARAASCQVAAAVSPSEAEAAFLHSHYEEAASLYSKALQAKPNDPELTAGFVDVLLEQQKVEEAERAVQQALVAYPKSAALQTALGFVKFREGYPPDAAIAAQAAMAIDPCYAKVRLLTMRLLRLDSKFKSAAAELKTGHLLAPWDPEIRRYWLNTLPAQQRITELRAYLDSPNGKDPDEVRRLRLYLDSLEKSVDKPHKPCRLVSSDTATTIPFAPIMYDATRIRAFGLDVKLNDRTTRLEIDTGASGLIISRTVANRAGLESFAATELGGIGSGPEKAGYTAYVDSIKIGQLEFHDCEVDVLDSRNVVGADGLIGMDVFSNLLVTLDYPMRKLELGPLPPRPTETAQAKPALETGESAGASAATEGASNSGPQDRYVAPEMKDWTRVYRIAHQLIIPAVLNEAKMRLFILDTGAFSTTISPAAAREVTKVHSDDSMVVRGISGKVAKVFEADKITFRFANLRQRAEGVVAFDTSNISKHTGTEISGFIGFATLSHLTLKIDYRDALVKFEYDANRGYR